MSYLRESTKHFSLARSKKMCPSYHTLPLLPVPYNKLKLLKMALVAKKGRRRENFPP